MAGKIKPWIVDWDKPQRVEIICHFKSIERQTADDIGKAIALKIPFLLYCEKSAVLFDVENLTAYWIGKQQAQFNYPDQLALIDGVKLQLYSHPKFFSLTKKLPIDESIRLISAVINK